MAGMYTSPERVVRDGRLVAFKGETMSEAEAARRGLTGKKPRGKAKPKPEPEAEGE